MTAPTAESKQPARLVYIGQRLAGNHLTSCYLEQKGDQWERVSFSKGLHRKPEIGAIYEATVTTRDGQELYIAQQEPADYWQNLPEVADWTHHEREQRAMLKDDRNRKRIATIARKCITPELRELYQQSGQADRHRIYTALIESLEKKG